MLLRQSPDVPHRPLKSAAQLPHVHCIPRAKVVKPADPKNDRTGSRPSRRRIFTLTLYVVAVSATTGTR